MNKIFSSIDIGTNTLTLLIAKIYKSKIKSLYQLEHITSLGEGLSNNNLIKSNSIERCIKYLIKFKKIIKEYDVEIELCVATSALRRAKNSPDVINQFNSIGIFPIIVSGTDEAKYIGNIVKYEFPNNINNTLVVDIGGGSTEFIYFNKSKIKLVESMNLGSVTLFEKCFSDPIIEKNILSSKNFILEKLNNSFIKNLDFDTIIGVGGTIASLSAIYNKIIPFNANKVHKSTIPINSLEFLSDELLNKTFLERSLHPVLELKRARVIPAGFLIFNQIMNYKKFNELLVCERGLRWGVIIDQIN